MDAERASSLTPVTRNLCIQQVGNAIFSDPKLTFFLFTSTLNLPFLLFFSLSLSRTPSRTYYLGFNPRLARYVSRSDINTNRITKEEQMIEYRGSGCLIC